MFVPFVVSQREKDIIDRKEKRAAARLDFKDSLLLRLFQCMCEYACLHYQVGSPVWNRRSKDRFEAIQHSFSFAVCCRSSVDFPLCRALDPCLHSPPSKPARPLQTTAQISILNHLAIICRINEQMEETIGRSWNLHVYRNCICHNTNLI